MSFYVLICSELAVSDNINNVCSIAIPVRSPNLSQMSYECSETSTKTLH